MPAALAISAIINIFLFLRYTGTIYELRSLHRQLEEIEQGSHIELCLQSRQKQMLNICKKLNQILTLHAHRQLHYEKAQKQLKQDITGLAHDIRTPLTGAAGYVQLAQKCGEPSTQQRYLQTALGRLNVLRDMLEELFLYTKLASEESTPELCDIQVLPLLSDCLVGMYQQFEEKGMEPKADFADEGFRVLADEECLRRIFHNLIQNALLHGAGEIVIRQENSSLLFENTVSETSRPDPEQIFDRFYKADSARRKGSSGLGLFIVKELAEKMDGSVRAELAMGKLRIILRFKNFKSRE